MASTPLAKLTPPYLGKIYRRQRLFRILDEVRSHPVVWISAPAGAGKTTLIASYLEVRKLSALWYQMDEGDGDVASFFYHLGLACEPMVRNRHQPLPLLTTEYLAGLPAFARNFFRELFERLEPPAVVVLDNYQDAPADSVLHEILPCGFSEIPKGVNVIVVSRPDPPAPMVRMHVSDSIACLGWRDLALTPEETLAIGKVRGAVRRLGKEEMLAIHRFVDGWMAGLILVLEHAAEAAWSGRLGEEVSRQEIFEYFAGEILDRVDTRTRSLLLATAFSPGIRPAHARALTGIAEAGEILARLVRQNCFISRHPGARMEYRYHPLFRSFLQARATDTLAAEEVKRVRGKAAELLLEDGDADDAVTLFAATGDWERIQAIVADNAPALIRQGRNRTLDRWIVRFPAEIIDRSGCLQYWSGVCRLPRDPKGAREFLERAFALFEAEHDLRGQLLAWCETVEAVVYEWGDFTPLERWIPLLDPLLSSAAGSMPDDLQGRISCAMFMALVHARPDHPDLPKWESRVWSMVMHGQDPLSRMNIGNHLLLYYTWWRGDLARARVVFETLRTISDTPGVPPLVKTTWQFMAAGFHWMNAENELAIAAADKGLAIAARTGVHIWDMFTCCQAVFATLSSDRLESARTYLDKMATLLDPARYMDSALYYNLLAWRDYLQGDLPLAREHARLSLEHASNSGNPFYIAIARIEYARVLFHSGDREPVPGILEKAHTFGRGMRSLSLDYLCWLAKAEFALVEGDESGCVEALRRCFDVTEGRKPFVNHTWWNSRMMTRLYATALEHGVATEYVRQVIRKRSLPPPSEGVVPDRWPFPVKLYTLGRFQLLLDDAPITFPGKARKKPLELLCALLAFGGRGVSDARLCDALWPDAEGDAAHHALETTLYRLRKLLGCERALIMQDGRLTLDSRYCWVDAWALRRLLGRLDAAVREHSSPMALVSIAERVLNMYQGRFLQGAADHPWALLPRERLHTRLQRTLVRVGQYLERRDEAGVAADCCERLLEKEPLAEDPYRRLMLCYRKMGHTAEALSIYERCREQLATGLGVSPSPEMEALWRELHEAPSPRQG